MKKQTRRMSEFLDIPSGCEDSVPFDEVLGKELVIERVVPFGSSYGPMVYLMCKDGKRDIVVRTGSGVVMSQLDRVEGELPLIAEFAQVKNYYTLR